MAVKGHNVKDVVWLQRRDENHSVRLRRQTYGSSHQRLRGGASSNLTRGQQYAGSVEAYQIKKKRFDRYLGYGHLTWSCREKMRCRHCGGEHGRRDGPRGSKARRADCGGPHSTGEQACKVQPYPPRRNNGEHPAHTPIKHREVKSQYGRTNQRSTDRVVRFAPHPRTTKNSISNTRHAPHMASTCALQ